VLRRDSTGISDAERIQKIQWLLEEKAIPFLLSYSSVEGIRKLCREGQLKTGSYL
jgi:hypothetical protein